VTRAFRPPSVPLLAGLLACSGAAALCCEVVWMRRLALATGSTGVAATLTLAVYMAGLGLGGWWAGGRIWRAAPRGYGLLEFGLGAWALLFPWLLGLLAPPLRAGPPWCAWFAAILLLPPGFLAGATLPAVAGALRSGREVGLLYATNTAGAVLGVLAGPLVLFSALGLRGTELAAAATSALVGAVALGLAQPGVVAGPPAIPEAGTSPRAALVAAAVAGFAAMALELCWTRLAALLVGASVYAMAGVLAVVLAAVAVGALLGRRGTPEHTVQHGLVCLGGLTVLGTWTYGALPHGLALAWRLGGAAALLPAGLALLGLAMAGAPVASGVVFSAAIRRVGGDATRAAGRILAVNTLGGVLGAALAGLVLVPWLGLQVVVGVVGVGALLAGLLLPPWPPGAPGWRGRAALAALGVGAALLGPSWDAQLYAVGIYHRIGELTDLSPRAVEAFAHEGWDLRLYQDGRTATVAVGESRRTGNRWLSINGKIDASTGFDMRTQELSGELPVRLAAAARGRPVEHAVVVGLASGVTAARALGAGAAQVTVIEIEPAVVRAAGFFGSVNAGLLGDPRAVVVEADARAWLARPGPRVPVIVSEPSNPWITGVSNLFTREYWELARGRLEPDGVFCQWVQLYSLPPDALRALVATFLEVFPDAWLVETIPGADALLLAAPAFPADLGVTPLLDPAGLRRFAAGARLNTDDRPWVELEAPRWLYRPTSELNREALLLASDP
jgi:spermidine synthase